jgi:hypothetical protein
LHSAKPSSKTKSDPNFVPRTVIGPTPKHNQKWINHCNAKVQRDEIHPQDRTDASRSDCDMLSKVELDLFTRKVDAVNAHLDSIYGKDKPHPQCCQRILINNHGCVIADPCTNLQHCCTIREFRLQRAGCTIESWPTIAQEDDHDHIDDVTPSTCPTGLLRPRDIANMSAAPSQHSAHQEARQHTAHVLARVALQLKDMHAGHAN